MKHIVINSLLMVLVAIAGLPVLSHAIRGHAVEDDNNKVIKIVTGNSYIVQNLGAEKDWDKWISEIVVNTVWDELKEELEDLNWDKDNLTELNFREFISELQDFYFTLQKKFEEALGVDLVEEFDKITLQPNIKTVGDLISAVQTALLGFKPKAN